MSKKVYYKVEYNPVSKTWCLFKHIEGEQSFNFYPIIQSPDKNVVQAKLDEINAKIEAKQKSTRINQKRSWSTMYNLYKDGKLIDTGTRNVLIKKYKVPQRLFNKYFYKRPRKNTDYEIEKIDKLVLTQV